MPIRPDIESELKLNIGRIKLFKGRLAEFRQMSSRKSDVLKMLGAGNVAGLIALATFLTGSERKDAMAFGGAILVAKLCFVIFGVGTGLFGRAFWLLYQFENEFDAILSSHPNEDVDWAHPLDQRAILSASESSRSLGITTACSLIALVCGSVLTFLGVLIFGR